MIGISQLTRIWTAQEPRPYKLGQIVDKAEGVDGVFEFIKYHHGQNSIRGIAGLPVFARQDATSTDDVDTDADTTMYDVSANFNGNTTSRRPRGILVGKRPPGFPSGGGVYQNLQFGWIQRSGKPIVDLWTDGNVAQGDRLYANRNPFMLDGTTAINVAHLIGSTRSVAVASDAATLGAPIGRLTDTTDITADALRAAITLTCGHIVAASNIVMTPLYTPTADTAVVAHVTPGAGSAVITLRNVSSEATAAADMTWMYAVLDALDNHFGKALQDDETNEILVLFPAGRTPDGTAALASYSVDETVTWTGGGTGIVREVFDSYAGSIRTQWGMRLNTVTGTLTGTATGGTSGATAANTVHNILYKLKAQNAILDIAA